MPKYCIEVIHQYFPFVAVNKIDNEDEDMNIRGKEEAKQAIAKALLRMGQELPKDDNAIEEEEVDERVMNGRHCE